MTAATSPWACPFHGQRAHKVSRITGRPFIGCPECNSFKRPGPAAMRWGFALGYPGDPPRLRVRPRDDLPF